MRYSDRNNNVLADILCQRAVLREKNGAPWDAELMRTAASRLRPQDPIELEIVSGLTGDRNDGTY